MARPLRITYPGAFYHVTSRGNERKAVFKSKRDRFAIRYRGIRGITGQQACRPKNRKR